MSETDRLAELLDLSRSSNKNDRRSAAQQLGDLSYSYPQAVATLEELSSDGDKKTRQNAEKSLKALRGRPLPPTSSDGYDESQIGDSDLTVGEVDHESSMSLAEEDRAELEASGKGLRVLLKETNNITIDANGNFVSREKGEGKLVVKNTGSSNRIFGIDLYLENLKGITPTGDTEFNEGMELGELDPNELWEGKYTFETEEQPISTKISYIDPETNLLPNFRKDEESTKFLCTIEVTNTTNEDISNVRVTKHIGKYGTAVGQNTTHGEGSLENQKVTFMIKTLASGETATMTVDISGKLPDDVEAYETGKLEVSYDQNNLLYSNLQYKGTDGISDIKQSLNRIEREEEPGVFDCELKLENISEFVYEMLDVKVLAGGIDGADTPVVDWDGTAVSEHERELVPGEKNEFEFVFETDEGTPTFGRKINFTVQSFVDTYTQTILQVPPEKLKFLSLGINKRYAIDKVPSYRETVVPTVIQVKGIGTYPLEALVIQDALPDLFSDVSQDAVEVYLNGNRLSGGYEISGTAIGDGPTEMPSIEEESPAEVYTDDETIEVSSEGDSVVGGFSTSMEEVQLTGRTLEVRFDHMEQNDDFAVDKDGERIAGLKEGDLLEIRYPTIIKNPPKDLELVRSPARAEAWIYDAEDQKVIVSADEVIRGIEVVHQRINVTLSKTVQGVKVDGQKGYRITIEGINAGTATVNFTVKDLIPTGFNIVGDTIEEPPVKSEIAESNDQGMLKIWNFSGIAPSSEVKVVYSIVGEPGAKYNSRDAMVVAQG